MNPRTTPPHDEPRDERLLAALRHAPDAEAAPPAWLSRRILDAATAATAPAASATDDASVGSAAQAAADVQARVAPPSTAAAPRWHQRFAARWLRGPWPAAAFASLLALVIVGTVMRDPSWRDEAAAGSRVAMTAPAPISSRDIASEPAAALGDWPQAPPRSALAELLRRDHDPAATVAHRRQEADALREAPARPSSPVWHPGDDRPEVAHGDDDRTHERRWQPLADQSRALVLGGAPEDWQRAIADAVTADAPRGWQPVTVPAASAPPVADAPVAAVTAAGPTADTAAAAAAAESTPNRPVPAALSWRDGGFAYRLDGTTIERTGPDGVRETVTLSAARADALRRLASMLGMPPGSERARVTPPR